MTKTGFFSGLKRAVTNAKRDFAGDMYHAGKVAVNKSKPVTQKAAKKTTAKTRTPKTWHGLPTTKTIRGKKYSLVNRFDTDEIGRARANAADIRAQGHAVVVQRVKNEWGEAKIVVYAGSRVTGRKPARKATKNVATTKRKAKPKKRRNISDEFWG